MFQCNDVDGLMKSLEHNRKCEEWQLFMDASKTSLKGALLDIRIKFQSICLFHCTQMKKPYENMKFLFSCIQHNMNCWNICGCLKVIALLVVTQLGLYAVLLLFMWMGQLCKISSLFCKRMAQTWAISNRTKEHMQWTISTSKGNICNSITYQASMMNFVEAMDHTRKAFQYLEQKFPQMTESKMK